MVYINESYRIRFQSKFGFIAEKFMVSAEGEEFFGLVGTYGNKKLLTKGLTTELILDSSKTYNEIERLCNQLETAIKKF